MSNELIELSNTLAQTTDRAAARVVAIHTESRGSASGIIWRPGVILTAEHALRRDDEIQVTLAGGRVASASLVGRDPSTDIAVLKCADAEADTTEFGDPATLKPGSLTLVVGRTRASGPVAALGVVSLVAADRRNWTGASLTPYIRLDVSLQPTAVGGAVVDAHGKIVGLATPRFARFGAIAVPAAAIHKVVDILLQKGRIPRGYLGVGQQTNRLPGAIRELLQADRKSDPKSTDQKTAVIVLEAHPGGPADQAGVVIGDIIVALDGRTVSQPEDVQSLLAGDAIGKSLPIKFVRGGAIQSGNIAVAERPHRGE